MNNCPCFGFFKTKKRRDDEEKQESKDESQRKDKSEARMEDRDMPIKSRPFSFWELRSATKNFDKRYILGRGGFGSVFKGKLSNGQVVAVKQLDRSGVQGDQEFLAETLMLSLLDHPNLVKMIGYCGEGSERLIVYEYMPLRSLDDHLFDLPLGKEALDWNTRMKIAAGTARGLEYLHNSDPSVIFRDLKPSNILLDEAFNAKISDFGLAKFGPSGDKSHVSTRVMGTRGYCAPEYAGTGQLTLTTDIYSYGIVLLEIITGKRAICEVNGQSKHIRDWVLELMNDRKNITILADPLLKGRFPEQSLARALLVASMCVEMNPELRPKLAYLVQAMEFLEFDKYKESSSSKDMNLRQAANWPEILLSPSRTAFMAEAKTLGETLREEQRLRDNNDDSEGDDNTDSQSP